MHKNPYLNYSTVIITDAGKSLLRETRCGKPVDYKSSWLSSVIISLMKRCVPAIILIGAFLVAGCTSSSEVSSAQGSSDYIENKGSDTLVNLALAWAEQYQVEHPEIQISVTGGGTAPVLPL
jgi:hypothetical protein